ncbi:hypothetical protein AB0K48_20735 [Nonomuraea sp. NPDC055795]
MGLDGDVMVVAGAGAGRPAVPGDEQAAHARVSAAIELTGMRMNALLA